MRIDECVAHLGRLTNLPDLRLDDERGLQIVFDDDTPLDIEFGEDEDRAYVSALILPAARTTAATHRRALTGNGFGLTTAGASFALDPVTGDLLLTHTFPLSATTVEGFAQALASLIDVAQAWRRDLLESAGGEAAPDAARLPRDFGMIRG